MERDFFGQEAAKTRQGCTQERAAAEADGAGEDYGGVIQEDIAHILKVWKYMAGNFVRKMVEDLEGLGRRTGHASLARRSRWGGGLKTPLGGAPPPHVFGVRALRDLQEV